MSVPVLRPDDGNPIFVQSMVTAYRTVYMAGALVSPTRVDLRVKAESAASYAPYTSITPVSTGNYSQQFLVDVPGMWLGEWIIYNNNGTINRTDLFTFLVEPNPVG